MKYWWQNDLKLQILSKLPPNVWFVKWVDSAGCQLATRLETVAGGCNHMKQELEELEGKKDEREWGFEEHHI